MWLHGNGDVMNSLHASPFARLPIVLSSPCEIHPSSIPLVLLTTYLSACQNSVCLYRSLLVSLQLLESRISTENSNLIIHQEAFKAQSLQSTSVHSITWDQTVAQDDNGARDHATVRAVRGHTSPVIMPLLGFMRLPAPNLARR